MPGVSFTHPERLKIQIRSNTVLESPPEFPTGNNTISLRATLASAIPFTSSSVSIHKSSKQNPVLRSRTTPLNHASECHFPLLSRGPNRFLAVIYFTASPSLVNRASSPDTHVPTYSISFPATLLTSSTKTTLLVLNIPVRTTLIPAPYDSPNLPQETVHPHISHAQTDITANNAVHASHPARASHPSQPGPLLSADKGLHLPNSRRSSGSFLARGLAHGTSAEHGWDLGRVRG